MSPSIAEGGGAAEVATHDFAALAGLYEAANKNHLSASEASAHNATQAGIAGAQMMNQSSMAADQLGQRQHEFQASQQVSDRDNWMANVQAHAAQQHAQLNAWLQGQELSQAESMRLQRMQNAVGEVQSRDDLDDQTKMDLITQLKTGIDPLRQRQEASKQKMMEEQHSAMMHQNAAAETMQQQDEAFAAGNFDKLPLVTDPETGKKHRMLRDKNGKWYDPFEARHTGGKEQPEVNDEGVTLKEHNAERAAAVKAANAFITAAEKPATPGGPPPPPATAEDRLAMQKQFMKEMYGRDLDWKPARAPQGQGNTPPATNPPGAAPTPPPAPAPTPIPKEPEKQTPDQKAILAPIQDLKKNLDNALIVPSDKKGEYAGYVDRLEKLVSDAGSFTALTPPQRQEYTDLMYKLGSINKPALRMPRGGALTPAERRQREAADAALQRARGQ